MLKRLTTLSRYYRTLTKSQAEGRLEQIQENSIKYKFHLNLHPGENYEGCADLEFDLKKTTDQESKNKREDLFLDFQGKEINECLVNGISTDAQKIYSKK